MTYEEFLKEFHEEIPEELLADTITHEKRLYHDPNSNNEWARFDWLFTGRYLGEERRGFRPSPYAIIRASKHAEKKAILDEKGAWLFLCGRDAFGRAVIEGTPRKGKKTFVYDENDDVIGIGEWMSDRLDPRDKNKPILKHRHDIGAYLRTR